MNNLNLKLCDYELEMEAFAAFRSRQLAAPRMVFMDHSHLHGNQLDVIKPDESDNSELTKAQVFLDDLHVVCLTEGGITFSSFLLLYVLLFFLFHYVIIIVWRIHIL